MKVHKLFVYILIAASFLMISACGGGGDSASYGEVAIDITDAKPLLPEGADQATNLTVTFTEILVHKSGGGWISLPLPDGLISTTIDLLQFSDGNTTEIVPPVLLEYGKYTQVRVVVSKAEISFDNGVTWADVIIPPDHLKTDKNFIFDVDQPTAVDIVIDFDLSQSLVVTDPFGTPSYQLKPVLHIVDTSEAATINGSINYGSFVDTYNAIVTVFIFNPNLGENGDYEEYTKVEVQKPDEEETTEFSIFWLAPNQDYIVEIDFDSNPDNDPKLSESVDDLGPGEVRTLNWGNEI